MSDLPRFACDIISAKPKRGDGLNCWLMSVCLALRSCGRTEDEIRTILRIETADDPIKPGEIDRAVERSAVLFKTDGTFTPRSEKWPALDTEARARIVAACQADAAELWEQSPHRFDDDTPHTEEIIDCLFPGNPLICVGMTSYDFTTAPREALRGKLSQCQLIVPSAMSKLTGLVDKGTSTEHESAHSNDNTGPRQYIVVEQDNGTADEQAAVIMHLAERAPLVLALRSGGKSLHAWFACGEQSQLTILCFFRYAVSLGADKALWTPCQFCRMPDGLRRRDDGTTTRQSVLFWNPGNKEAAA